MKVSLTRHGGFLDLDQRVEVNGPDVSITDAGVTRRIVPADRVSTRTVSELARHVAELPDMDASPAESSIPAYDEMLTEIEIEDEAGGVRRLSVTSGADAPPAVWELIRAVDRCLVQ